jgi:hypothetical protein
MNPTVKITRAGGTPISPYAFGNNYFNWVDWNKDGMIGILGTKEPVKALRLNVVVGDNNQNDANTPQLFDQVQMDKYIQYCRAVGPELGWRYYEGNDWLTPMLDECKDYIDVVSIHHYGFAARDLSVEGALTDVDRFRQLVHDVKACIAKHARH